MRSLAVLAVVVLASCGRLRTPEAPRLHEPMTQQRAPGTSAPPSAVRTIEIELWPLDRSFEIWCGTMDHRPRPDPFDELVRCGDRC